MDASVADIVMAYSATGDMKAVSTIASRAGTDVVEAWIEYDRSPTAVLAAYGHRRTVKHLQVW